jgi:hypothetical protein
MRMKILRFAALAAVCAIVLGLLAGCESESATDVQSADAHFAQGYDQLEEEMQDVDMDLPPWEWEVDASSAYEHFEDALDADPNHCGALLMASLTRLLVVITDPELAEILNDIFEDEWEMRGRSPLFWYLAMPDVRDAIDVARSLQDRQRDDFPFSELQDYIEDEVLPALAYVDGNLSDFEDLDCEVTLVFDIPEERESVTVVLDATDAYFAHAPLDVLQAVFEMTTAYNVDVADGQTLQELLTTDPDFLSLRAGSHMQTAFGELEDMVDHVYDACDELESETGPQTFDLITESDGMYIVLDDMFGAGSVDSIRFYVGLIDEAMHDEVEIDLEELEPGAPPVVITLDVEELFMDPLDPITDYLPAMTWPDPDDPDVVRPVNFPDPTFSDIMPGMTNASWEAIAVWMDEE